MAREIDVTISKDGQKVEFDLNNFEASSCKDFIGSIMNKLGEVEKEKKKPEFFKKAHQAVRS